MNIFYHLYFHTTVQKGSIKYYCLLGLKHHVSFLKQRIWQIPILNIKISLVPKMCSTQAASAATKAVRPLMSTDFCEARRRALGLYRDFYRYIPYIIKYFDIQKNEEDCRWKLREYFYKNACITDVRVIDLLVIKGYIELKEVTHQWQQKGHVMRHWNASYENKPSDFIGKFLAGMD